MYKKGVFGRNHRVLPGTRITLNETVQAIPLCGTVAVVETPFVLVARDKERLADKAIALKGSPTRCYKTCTLALHEN